MFKKAGIFIVKNRNAIIFASLFSILGYFLINYFYEKNSGLKIFVSGYDAFGNEKWIVDKKTGIAMSFENNTNSIYDYFTVRYSSLKNGFENKEGGYHWVGEYFCQPDSIVIMKNDKDEYQISYLPYLKWRKDFFIAKDGSFGRISVIKDSVGGKLDQVDKLYTDRVSDLNLNIRRDSTLGSGNNFSRTDIYIKNKYSYPVDLYYIVQDAAYMNFNKGNSVNVFPISLSFNETVGHSFRLASDQYKTMQNNDELKNFVGSYRSDFNILAGFYTDNDYAILGLKNKYLGIEKSDGAMQALVVDNDLDKIVSDAVNAEQFSKIRSSDFVNRFIIFPVIQLQPEEERNINFYRIMIDKSDEKKLITLEEWSNIVSQVVKKEISNDK